jgi:uroporphyrinogen decarboxylase
MEMTSSQRLQASLSHREPDRVPYALAAAMHPAKEMGLTIKEYFSRPGNVVEGQMRLRRKFGNDILCCYPFAALELQAWGGEVIYVDQGPPQAGAPIIKRPEDILALKPPPVAGNPVLQAVLEATSRLKAEVGDDIPIAGVVVSPASLPIMQMGFTAYLDLIHDHPDLLQRLLRANTEYCTAWANAQLKAGAASIMYYDPVFSPTIMSRDFLLQYGLPTARDALSRIKGAVMIHLASGRGLPVVPEIAGTGFMAMGASADEDLGALKAACKGRLAVVGNLNALAMRHWSAAEAESEVRKALALAGPGGGFVLSDNHGEIPFLVEEDILLEIVEAVRRWGRYPLDWVNSDEA